MFRTLSRCARAIVICCLMVLVGTDDLQSAEILTASRTSGPAPLAVLFDASSVMVSGVDLPFHQLIYEFDFGDKSAGIWPLSRESKNTQKGGPIAAHVFERPGTYTVRVRAIRPGNAPVDSSVRVTVQDPDIVFAGKSTICVSAAGNFTGSPAGSLHEKALPSSYAGKRVLLRAGEEFGRVEPLNTDSAFQIGSFGSGEKPRIGAFHTGMRRGVAEWAHDFTVMNLNILGGVNIDATTNRFLLYGNDINTPGEADSMVNVGTAAGYYQAHETGPVPGAIYWPREVFIVGNNVHGKVDSTGKPNLVLMGYFVRSAIMGNTMDRATEHTLRIWAAQKVFIGHNLFGGNHYAPNPPGIRSAIKIHSCGTDEWTETVSTSRKPRTNQVVVANNIIGSVTYPGSWLSGLAPENADPGTIQGLEDCIIENNTYVRGPYTTSELQLRGRRMTARGNTLQGGGVPDIVRCGARFDPGMAEWDGPYFLQR